MNSERWSKVKSLFDRAMELDSAERSAFLEAACGSDAELRRDVESLIVSSESSDSFLEQPAAQQMAGAILDRTCLAGTGDTFSHYTIVRQLGVGGMGEVYLADDEKLGRKVAIKLLNEQFGKDDLHLERFVREAKAASSLNHPNILVIHEIGTKDGVNFIVSEFVEGETLRELIRRGELTIETVLDISTQIAGALTTAHEAGIVHRDIKPENVVVRPDGYVKVLDFGLAKLMQPATNFLDGEQQTAKHNRTAQGVIMGTVNYMSPEQAKGASVDERTDIFSLGAVIYELLTGSPPFEAESMSETFAKLLSAEPAPVSCAAPSTPPELERIVTKALQKDKNERYQTARELNSDLKTLRDNVVFREKFGTVHIGGDKDPTKILSPATGIVDPSADSVQVNGLSGHLSRPAALAVAAVLAVASMAAYWYLSPAKVDPAGTRRSLAVLPFTNVGQDVNAEYLADGVTESIINDLSQVSGLRVMSRNSSFRFKNDQSDVRAIASQLNVDTLVTGDVKQLGDKVVINVRLTNAADDSQIWGDQYVRTLTDVLTAQNEIAQAVAQNLKVRLSAADSTRINKRYTENSEAYQLFLRGRFHVFKLTPPEIQQGIANFQKAIDLDPNYALAYVGLSDAFRSLVLSAELDPSEYLPKSKAAAKRAVEIDDSLSDGHAALGVTLFWGDWDWAGAERHFKQALELNPSEVNAHLFYAHLMSNTGRHAEALAEVKIARELDPLFPFAGALEGQMLLYAGRPDESLDRLQKTFELAPNFWMPHVFAANAYIDKGMYAEALVETRKAIAVPGASTYAIALESYALAKSGKTDEARSSLSRMLEISKARFMPPMHLAIAYNGLGDTQKALEWLEKGYELRDPKMAFLKVDTKLNNLRSEPRFIELMKRMSF